jgi:alkylation response protein AidB-like acyl-CoA dehydrogenase
MVTEMASADTLLALARSDEQRRFVMDAVTFVSGQATPRVQQNAAWGVGDEALTLFHETSDEQEHAEADAARRWQKLRWQAGFGWITGPVEFGGRGLSADYEALYRRVESSFEIPDMSPLRIGIGTVGPAILGCGTAEQVSDYVVPIYRGEIVACQLFSEPAAGSDLAGVRTRATEVDGGWAITGQKVWTSNASFADIGLALVRTDAQAPKHKGLTMMVVPMNADGVTVRPLRQMTGGASFTEVFLDQVVVPHCAVVGDVGAGWQVATRALAGERKAVGDRTHEVTDRAIGLLRELAQRTGRIGDPQVRQQWSQVYSRLRIARFQQQRVQAISESELSGAERAIDKLLVSSNLRALGDLAGAILEQELVVDSGQWGTFGWNKWIMGAFGYRIAGGTEEILKTMLAERVLMLPRETR